MRWPIRASCALVLVLALLGACVSEKQKELKPGERAIILTGIVFPIQEAEVLSPLPAVVGEVLAEPGQRVRAGQVLVRLDAMPYRADVLRAEAGLSIAHAQYHKHSAYVLSNADMPGFSRVEQQRLARIVLAHRGKLEKVRSNGMEDADWPLVFALRLASTMLRRRTSVRLPALKVAAGDARFSLELPKSWLARNALTAAALESEARQWEAIGLQLSIRRLS